MKILYNKEDFVTEYLMHATKTTLRLDSDYLSLNIFFNWYGVTY